MTVRIVTGLTAVLLLLATAGCGKSAEEKQRDAAEQAWRKEMQRSLSR